MTHACWGVSVSPPRIGIHVFLGEPSQPPLLVQGYATQMWLKRQNLWPFVKTIKTRGSSSPLLVSNLGGGGLGTTLHSTRKDLLENKGVTEEGRGRDRDRQMPDQTV